MRHSLKNIWRLGVKELWSLWRDPVMLVLIVYTFTAVGLHRRIGHARDAAPRARSPSWTRTSRRCRQRITSAFYPPHFMPPQLLRRCKRWTPAWTRASSPLR